MSKFLNECKIKGRRFFFVEFLKGNAYYNIMGLI